jgi:hypothetical protein
MVGRSLRTTAAVAILAAGTGCSDGSSPEERPPSSDGVPWTAALERDEDAALLVTPATALGAARVYAVVLTRAIADRSGRAVAPSADLARAIGAAASPADGPVARSRTSR